MIKKTAFVDTWSIFIIDKLLLCVTKKIFSQTPDDFLFAEEHKYWWAAFGYRKIIKSKLMLKKFILKIIKHFLRSTLRCLWKILVGSLVVYFTNLFVDCGFIDTAEWRIRKKLYYRSIIRSFPHERRDNWYIKKMLRRF